MRILNVSGFDIVGPLANGYLLHREYLKRGIESQMAVWKKGDLSDPTIHELRDGASNYVNFASVFLEKKLSLYSVLPAAGFQLYFKPYYRNADIVHLHLPHVTSFFSIFNFPLMGSDKRHHVVLNVHDMFFMTGLCHYSLECDRWMTGCGHCPDLSRSFPVRRDTTAFMWKLKKWAFERSSITVLVQMSEQGNLVSDAMLPNAVLDDFGGKCRLHAPTRRFGVLAVACVFDLTFHKTPCVVGKVRVPQRVFGAR